MKISIQVIDIASNEESSFMSCGSHFRLSQLDFFFFFTIQALEFVDDPPHEASRKAPRYIVVEDDAEPRRSVHENYRYDDDYYVDEAIRQYMRDQEPHYAADGAVIREVLRDAPHGREPRSPRSRSAGRVEEVVIYETDNRGDPSRSRSPEGRYGDYVDRRYKERSPRSRSAGRVEEIVIYEHSDRSQSSSEGRYGPWGDYTDRDFIIPQSRSNARPTHLPQVKKVSRLLVNMYMIIRHLILIMYTNIPIPFGC